MRIKAVQATEENFKPFGTFLQVRNDHPRTGEGGWQAWMTKEPCMDDVCNIGITYAQGMPFCVDSMECLLRTQEVLACGDKPMVLAVADSDPAAPGADPKSIRAFVIRPGQLVTLDRGIWHDACRSAEGDGCYYYFLAHSLDPAVFRPVSGEPVEVTL
jgi:ureidoglycolate lyase